MLPKLKRDILYPKKEHFPLESLVIGALNLRISIDSATLSLPPPLQGSVCRGNVRTHARAI